MRVCLVGIAIARGSPRVGLQNSKEFLIVKRILSIILAGIVLTTAVVPGLVNAQSVQGAVQDQVQVEHRAAKVRMDVLKMGVGEKARVEIKLRDNSKLKGYIGEASEDSFTVVDSKNGSNQRLEYASVNNVKKAGGSFSTRSWIILGAAVAGAVATWVVVKPALCDGGAQTRGPC
jgi:hypothetical protein